jgi:hypothetical protein
MAQNPEENAATRGLSKDVLADFEEAEGPATGAQTGANHTRIGEHEENQGHGAKTRAHTKAEITNKTDGGTH